MKYSEISLKHTLKRSISYEKLRYVINQFWT